MLDWLANNWQWLIVFAFLWSISASAKRLCHLVDEVRAGMKDVRERLEESVDRKRQTGRHVNDETTQELP
jgi:hypothetical protein